MITNDQRISLNCAEAVTDFTKESGFNWKAQPCGAFPAKVVLQNALVSPTDRQNEILAARTMRPAFDVVAAHCHLLSNRQPARERECVKIGRALRTAQFD